jgi:vesicular inhibitory amino acid transporter
MREPARFPTALAASFGIMLAVYSTLAAAGYYYWGDGASPLVTADIARSSWFTSHSRLPVHRILVSQLHAGRCDWGHDEAWGGDEGRGLRDRKPVACDASRVYDPSPLPHPRRAPQAGIVLLNTLTKYPSLNLCLQDMILSVLPLHRDPLGQYHPPLKWAAGMLRLALFAGGTVLALTAYSVLGSALSLMGGIGSISCSLLLPTAFYALLAWRRLSPLHRAGLSALLGLGTLLVCLIAAMNICDMSASCHAWHTRTAAAPVGIRVGWTLLG